MMALRFLVRRTLRIDVGAWACVLLSLAVGCASVGTVREKGARVAEDVCEIVRDETPDGLSGISHIAGNRYYCVDDSGGMLHEVEIVLDEEGGEGSFTVLRSVRLVGRKDLEGCAVDPLDGGVWVSDESDHSIRRYDPRSGCETAKVSVPEVYAKNMVPNRSFEALSIAPDGLRMYAANEDTLACDGAVADRKRGGRVRIQEFVRASADRPWMATRQFIYPTEKVDGEKYAGLAVSGVVALCAPGDGALLVLEREMSRKNPLFPTFHARLFEIDLADAKNPVRKRTVWDEETMFVNYEGLCLGPALRDGTRTLVLVSDGDGDAEECVRVLSLKTSVVAE